MVHSEHTQCLILASGRWLIIALTNNYSKHITGSSSSMPLTAAQPPIGVPDSELRFLGWEDGAKFHLRALFDDFCDSSELGMRYVRKTLNQGLHEVQ